MSHDESQEPKSEGAAAPKAEDNHEHKTEESAGHAAVADHHAKPALEPLFAAPELEAMHADDRSAAKHIILLMVSIFLTGIIIYSAVDYFVFHARFLPQ